MGGGRGDIFNLYQTNNFEGLAPEDYIDNIMLPRIEQRARDGFTDMLSLKNIRAGSELGGDLLRPGKG